MEPLSSRSPFTRASLAALFLLVAGCAVPEPETEGPEMAPSPLQGQPAAQPVLPASTFATFESGQVRPLALTPNKKWLLATNTPDGRVELFRVKSSGLDHVASIPVGLEPVAVAVRNNGEAWVVNHLSDSVSIVALDGEDSHVTRTLLVGDEPRDIVFAGPGKQRAFITTAHRGQSSPHDPQLTTPGVGRADVWVFDAVDAKGCHDTSPGGTPLGILTFFADTPRALAVTPDGSRVYVAAFHSGNATATTFGGSTQALTTLTPLAPATNAAGEQAPFNPVIVKYDGAKWLDETGQDRSSEMMFSLPDKDVFVIDAAANPPQPVAGPAGVYAHVGTTLFNMVVNPASGKVYVSNLEANNQQRFEGQNSFAGAQTVPEPSIRGKLALSRITVLGPAGAVSPRHLNKHIDYGTCCAPVPNAENAKSLAFPNAMAITASGGTLYVAALGSSKIGVHDTAALESDSFVPSLENQIPVSGGGPTGLALDEGKGRLYVLTRFDNSISIINTVTRAEIGHVPMFNPEPPEVVNGRKFLYDAALTSSHGDSACASCHIFGDMDHLAWDLGNPDLPTTNDPNVYANPSPRKVFHSMKGPMVTQSLRGMDNHGPMHWRGDRTGAGAEPSAQPDSGAFDERAAFMAFNVAFEGLLGRSAPLSDTEMASFTDFALELMYPPNPIRHLDSSLTATQQIGKDIFSGGDTFFDPFGPALRCDACHVLDPAANAGFTTRPGFFGTDGRSADVAGLQNTKTPHLRNLYQRVGKFGFPTSPILPPSPGAGTFMGDQISGFGFSHDGGFDTVFRFFFAVSFADTAPVPTIFGVPVDNPEGLPLSPEGFEMRRALEDYMLVFDSNFAPIVGQQVTLTSQNKLAAGPRVTLLLARAQAGECDLVARDEVQGYLYEDGMFRRNKQNKSPLTPSQLRQKAIDGSGVTYTCAPPGNGRRVALDRDLDGSLDGDDQHPDDPTQL